MSLLQEIQSDLISEKTKIGPIFLKFRLLAARLGSDDLEEWVKHESEGYPSGVETPNYRTVRVSYTASFSGPFGSGMNNAPIPPYLIKKYAGDVWNVSKIRQSIAAIDDLIVTSEKSGGSLSVNSSNLMLLLNGNVYPDYSCNSVIGHIPNASLAEIQHAVRSRILELTIELERKIPESKEITLSSDGNQPATSETTTKLFHQVINGNITSIANSGDNSNFSLSIEQGDKGALTEQLIEAGIAESDARELADIVDSESGGSKDEPFGRKAQEWIGKNLSKAANGTWKIGTSVATKVLTEAALKYYGLK